MANSKKKYKNTTTYLLRLVKKKLSFAPMFCVYGYFERVLRFFSSLFDRSQKCRATWNSRDYFSWKMRLHLNWDCRANIVRLNDMKKSKHEGIALNDRRATYVMNEFKAYKYTDIGVLNVSSVNIWCAS